MIQLRDLSSQVDTLIEESKQPTQRISTGLPAIDALCGGPAKGEVYTVIGRSFAGKSIVGQHIIYHNRKLPSILFSLEMPASQALKRIFSMHSGIANSDVQRLSERGQLPESKLRDMQADFGQHVIVDKAGISLEEMTETLYLFKERYETWPAFVVMDYLELVGGAKRSGDGYLATEAAAQAVKDWAKDHEMPVFLLHQTNMREDPWKPPTQNSARGAGYTEADFIIGLWQPGTDPELEDNMVRFFQNKLYFNVLKNRAYGLVRYEPIVYTLLPNLRLEQIRG